MKSLGNVFSRIFGGEPLSPAEARRRSIYREWDKQRANAFTQSQVAEIDAIFSRALD